jgi:hypothetical protein
MAKRKSESLNIGGTERTREGKIKAILAYGSKALGKIDLINHLKGKNLRTQQAIRAKCFDCMGYYADGTDPCGVFDCPLEPLNPYREGGVRKLRIVGKKGDVQAELPVVGKEEGNA